MNCLQHILVALTSPSCYVGSARFLGNKRGHKVSFLQEVLQVYRNYGLGKRPSIFLKHTKASIIEAPAIESLIRFINV